MPGPCAEKIVVPCCFLSRHAFSLGTLSSSCSCSSTAQANVAPAPISTWSPVGRGQATANKHCPQLAQGPGQQPKHGLLWHRTAIDIWFPGTREQETDRQADRQTYRQTDRQTDRQTHTSALATSATQDNGSGFKAGDLAYCHWTHVTGHSCLTGHTPLHEPLDEAK